MDSRYQRTPSTAARVAGVFFGSVLVGCGAVLLIAITARIVEWLL